MLPFLKAKKIASVVSEARKVDGTPEQHNKEDHSLAKRLIDAIHAKDADAVALVLKELQAEDEAEDV